jgi:hypothetical protein
MTRFFPLIRRLGRRRTSLFVALLAVAGQFAISSPARADPPSTHAVADADLRFGTIVVFGSGTRTVTPAGGVTTSGGIISGTGDSPGPARFTVGYNRGNEGNSRINVVFAVTFGAVPPVTQGGVTATVTNLTSNLPGALNITPGLTVQMTVNNCRVRICGASFDVGGTLNVTRSFGGAFISTPVPVSVTVLSVN